MVAYEMALAQRYEVWIKWLAHAVVIAATVATAFDIVPANKVIFIVGCVLWTWVGLIWRQPSLWILNLFCGAVYVIGLMI
jgi:hypothetical protein